MSAVAILRVWRGLGAGLIEVPLRNFFNLSQKRDFVVHKCSVHQLSFRLELHREISHLGDVGFQATVNRLQLVILPLQFTDADIK